MYAIRKKKANVYHKVKGKGQSMMPSAHPKRAKFQIPGLRILGN